MNDLVVVAAAIAAIAWVNWYFLLSERRSGSATSKGGVQEVTIIVAGGYDPAVVRVRRSEPVRLIFERRETAGCSEEVVIPEFGIRKYLPAHRKTTIEITPEKAGSYEFTCGMSMLHGRLVVEDQP